ncbi:Transcription factor tau subunit sfc4 [Hypsizygus marmoreus]|uniref:Transcription factor tau subunit sfc4 n=1 Tax=Hypsizygus marmoreus TaxID=39966 RepID=A0A369JH92_HYPMA|nr:Transcription factor tau subunit sfc4 [Hypsizygus marmoreus]
MAFANSFAGPSTFTSDDELIVMEEEDAFGSDNPDSFESSDEDEEEEEESDEDEESRGLEEGDAEEEIEGDFDRLVQNIRSHDGPSTNTGLNKDWDFNIEEKDAEFRDDLREASGVGKRRKKAKGRQAGPVLSQQVRSLIGDGNQAYVDSNLPEAVRIMQEVIRIEPRAASAWSVLAQCYEDMNQPQKALQLRIMAAHLRHDADEWDRLANQSRELGYNQQALYCYRKVYSLDPTNVDALWDRASLAKETGDLKTSRNAFLAILKRFPHDLTVLAELRTILIELSELSTCANLFQQAFTHYQKMYPSGRGMDIATNSEISGGGFGLMEILVLADLFNTLGEYDRAVDVIRKGCRWLQGRADQKYWDLCDDDREYDLPETTRITAGEDGAVAPGRYPLDINARHRLAVARIKMGEVEEGKLHANAVLSQDVLDYAALFAEIADAYFDREMYAEARPIYELLGGDAATSSLYILLQTAACLRMLDELKEAAEVYEHVRLADPTHNETKMKLAEIYETLNEPRKALELVYEVIDSRKKRPKETGATQAMDSTAATTSLFEERAAKKSAAMKAQGRLTHAQLRELEAQKEKDVLKGYKRAQELWPQMLSHDEEAERLWLVEAEKLVETFRETRNLFLTTRTNPFRGMFPRSRRKQETQNEADEDRMASRLHLDLEHDTLSRKSARDKAVDVFRGVSFADWLRLITQYCFLLTTRGQYEVADEILRHILVSNAYQARERQDTIRLALIACAIAEQRPTVVVEHARKLITVHQFNNELQRILIAVLSSGLRPTDAFITSTLQKHLFREMKLADTAVKNPEVLRWNPLNKRYAPTATVKAGDAGEPGDEDADDVEPGTPASPEKDTPRTEIPTKNNPIIVAIYGQICIAAKSYQSAIFYLLHAYDYCPEDPMICLCLAIASIGRAMQRQSDNRHHLITQAMGFLTQYRKFRTIDSQTVGEVEYNFGRAFHQLGLYSHAVKHYELVLEYAEMARPTENNFAREAAYNLSLIFVMTGATSLADALYRRWLSI